MGDILTYRKDQKYNRSFLGRIVDKYIVSNLEYIVSRPESSEILRKGALFAGIGLGFLFGGEYVNAQEPTKAEAQESLADKAKKYVSEIRTYKRTGKKDKQQEETQKLEKELLQSTSSLEEAIKIINTVDQVVSDQTIAAYATRVKYAVPEDAKQKKQYQKLLKELHKILYFKTILASPDYKFKIELSMIPVLKVMGKEIEKRYSALAAISEKEIKELYKKSNEKNKKIIEQTIKDYRLNIQLQPPKEEAKPEVPVEKPEPAKEKPKQDPQKEPKKPKAPAKKPPAPKKIPAKEPTKPKLPPKKPSIPKKKTPKKRTPPKPSRPKEPELTREELENQALDCLTQSHSQIKILGKIRLEERALSLYNKAESKNPKIQEYNTIIENIKKRLLDDYAKWLMPFENKQAFERALLQATRILGADKAQELERRLKYSEARKKRGTDKIANQAHLEATTGRNIDSTVTDQRLRIAKKDMGEILQQHREERMKTRQNEEKVTKDDSAYAGIGVQKLKAFLEAAGGREQTTLKSKDFDTPASSTHTSESKIKYKTKITKNHGGISAQVDLKELVPILISAGGSCGRTEIYTTTKTLKEITNINNPNGDYPEETITKTKNYIREKMIFLGADRISEGGRIGSRIGYRTLRERYGTGDQRTIRNTDELWGAFRTQVMLNKCLGIGGVIIQGLMKDELYPEPPEEEFERSRENDIFTKPRGGIAGVASLPGPLQLTAFGRLVQTEDISRGGGGIVITTGRNDKIAKNLLEMLVQETESDLGILPGQAGKVKDLIDSTHLSLFSAMVENGNKWGLGLGARGEVWNVPGEINAWLASGAAALETPEGTILAQAHLHQTPYGRLIDCRLSYMTPDQRLNLELIVRQKQGKDCKDMSKEVGAGFGFTF